MKLVDLGAELLNVTSRLGSLRVDRELPYGPHDRNRLDIYHPHARRPNTPALVFSTGAPGSKARDGCTSSSACLCVTWLQDHHSGLSASQPGSVGISAGRWCPGVEWIAGKEHDVVLLGHSAGAQIAGSLAYAERWRVARPVVRAFVGLAGPYRYIGDIGRHALVPALLLALVEIV